MLIRKIPVYDFGNPQYLPLDNADFLNDKFYISLPALPQVFDKEKVLLSIPDALELRIIKRSYNDEGEDNASLKCEGCFYFNEADEWILEAEFNMCVSCGLPRDKYFLRLPISAPFMKDGNIGIYFDGTWVRFMKDGEILNENSGMDCFCKPSGDIFTDDMLKGIRVARVENVTVTYREEKTEVSPAFYFPEGWNANVGDVMAYYHDGTYHIMYLFDRRHHGSRNGAGAHYIAHLTTENLVDWYEQKPIAEIDRPWLTYGTGTMVFHDGRYYISYGLHTERYRGMEEKIEPVFNEKTGLFEAVTYEEIFSKGGLPAGAAYSVSDNGIDFVPGNLLFHAARNPSAYKSDNGGIILYCGYRGDGVFESESFDKPFGKSDRDFDFLNNAIMRNSSECPAFFSWNGYKYLIVGFTGYFRTLCPGSEEFVDASAMGENIYDGLSVPMVAEYGERRIIAGWVKSPRGWGGVMMQRELVQEDGGKLGMKWIPELLPELIGENLFGGKNITEGASLEKHQSYYLEITVNPESAKHFGISLEDGLSSCVTQLDFEEKRVQVGKSTKGCFAKRIPTMLEQMKNLPESITYYKSAGIEDIPQNACDYALSDITGIDNEFVLKMLIRYSKRLRSTVLDVEIAEKRTLISVRDGFFPEKVSFLKDGDLTFGNTKLYVINTAEY